MTLATYSGVSGSMYVLSAVSGSVMIVGRVGVDEHDLEAFLAQRLHACVPE